MRLDDRDIGALPIHQRAQAGLGYLPQETSVFRGLTVKQNLLAVLELNRTLGAKERDARAQQVMEELGLTTVAESKGEIGRLKKRGLGVLMTDHNVRDTLAICDRAYIISAGQILEAGTPQQLAESTRARSVYLGEKFKLG